MTAYFELLNAAPYELAEARALRQQAQTLFGKARYTEAEPLLRRALAIQQKLLGPYHLDVADTLSRLADLYQKTSHDDKAEPLYQQALIIEENKLGNDNLEVANTLDALAQIYKAQGRFDESKRLIQRSDSIRKRIGIRLASPSPALAGTAAVSPYAESDFLKRLKECCRLKE